MFHGQLSSAPKPNNAGHVLGPTASSVLLVATHHVGLESAAPADEDHPNTFRCVKLVSGERKEIEFNLLHIDLHFARGLYSVGVKEHALAATDGANLLDRENHPGLVVPPHDGNNRGVGPNGGIEQVQIERTVRIHRQ